MSEHQGVWSLAAALGIVFASLSIVNLAFVDGDPVRDVVAAGLGGLLTLVAYARWRSWKGVRE